ncbi:Peptidase S10, serine carboxypeptidase [Corchorus capsularis]|uniref:Carboxypeptidase n=1 Tax=Corchorus capsularis TaxID=210143 RepID=A0A1R3IJT5_COCAP|nr:Peptidase S10, serine carboxypeptidase [Corchorus capsularis]
MASTFCQNLLLLSFFLLFASFSVKAVSQGNKHQLHISPTSRLAKLNAEKLIRALNLFPEDDVNGGLNDFASVETPKLVEKQFRFPVLDSAGPSVQEFGHHAGYFKLPHTKSARMFYFFFESRNSKNDPVVIWLTGGPGCSSELALFYENGPFHLSKNLSLVWNDYGWDKASNILFVDQPTGTGFSYTSDEDDIRHDETGVSNDLYDFLQEFFKAHPQYVKNDFYITGESYAGHYIPAFAVRVHQGNKAKEGIHVNFKGFAIGNGLTNPEIQYQAYPDYALNTSLITQADYISIKKQVPSCVQAIRNCGSAGGDACMDSYQICNNVFNSIMGVAGDINYYDIRKQCEGNLCYDFSDVETFLNQKSVRDALGVGEIEFVSCSSVVYEAMILDWMKNLEVGIPALLEDGIKVLIYAGEYDLICNWLGNSKWVHAMKWSGQKEFGAAPTVPFVVDGSEAGQLKSHGPLAFLKVHDAGHMVPMDQPKASLQMLQSWMQGKLASSGTPERVSPKYLPYYLLPRKRACEGEVVEGESEKNSKSNNIKDVAVTSPIKKHRTIAPAGINLTVTTGTTAVVASVVPGDANHNDIDEDLRSRRLAVYVRETMRRLFASDVLISGMQGLGAEIVCTQCWCSSLNYEAVLFEFDHVTVSEFVSCFYNFTEDDIKILRVQKKSFAHCPVPSKESKYGWCPEA